MFSNLPFWAVIVGLLVVLVVKDLLLQKLETSSFYVNAMKAKGWMATLLIVSGLNALLTLFILVLPAGKTWAIIFAIVDFIVHWLIGYWKVKKMLPKIDEGNWQTAEAWLAKVWKWVTAIHSATYVSFISTVVTLFEKHPTWLPTVLKWVHLSA